MKKSFLSPILAASLLAAGAGGQLFAQDLAPEEMRGMWISTVFGLDFPGGAGSSPEAQRNRILTLLDEAEAAGLNSILFQVRGEGDAFYISNYEPWSRWLSGGNQGTAPTRPWDPFQFVIDECRRRGLEVQAWMNPYRAGINPAEDFDPDHAVNDQSALVEFFTDSTGSDYYWFNPGDPAAETYLLDVIDDIVTRYDIDALHFDDYFYPYNISEPALAPFPDSSEFATFGGSMSLADWRRDNINNFITTVQGAIGATPGKSHVRFGVSPSGIWRNGTNGGPAGISGLESFSALYADSRAWLQNGWVDYLAPQIYWGRSAEGFRASTDYDAIQNWWTDSAQNPLDRLVVTGLPAYKITTTDSGNPTIYEASSIVSMVNNTQADLDADGSLFFRADNLNLFEGLEAPLGTQLAAGPYSEKAITPPATWLDSTLPSEPLLAYDGTGSTGYTVYWTPQGSEFAQWYAVYWRDSVGVWNHDIVPDWQRSYEVPGSGVSAPTDFAVAAVDRVGNSSATTVNSFSSATPNPVPAQFTTTTFIDFDTQDLDFGTSSGSNSGVTTATDVATSAEYNNRLDPRTGDPGVNSRQISFDWDGASGGRYRLTTFGTNPQVDLSQGFGLYVKLLEGELEISLMIRETGGVGPIGADGGSLGALEETDGQIISASPNWQYIYFDVPNENYTNFFGGNGVLDGSWGVFEALLIRQVASDPTTAFDLYLDDIHQGEPHTMIGEPLALKSITASQINTQDIELSWTASPAADLKGYRIYRSTSPNVAKTSANLVTEVGAVTSFLDTGLTADTDYYYVVTVVDQFGYESALSPEVVENSLPVELDAFSVE